MWHDAGYGVGVIAVDLTTDLLAVEAAFDVTGGLVIVSSGVVFVWMEETHPEFGTHEPPAVGHPSG